MFKLSSTHCTTGTVLLIYKQMKYFASHLDLIECQSAREVYTYGSSIGKALSTKFCNM